MTKLQKAELLRKILVMAEMWEQRQQYEELLGIPTSDKLTEQFIRQEAADLIAKDYAETIRQMVRDGEIFGIR